MATILRAWSFFALHWWAAVYRSSTPAVCVNRAKYDRISSGGACVTEDLRSQLAAMVDEADWSMLTLHALDGRVVMVDPNLDLIGVGMAVANDESSQVSHWLAEKLIYKPDEMEIRERNRLAHRYRGLIVRPFVLVQEIEPSL